MTMRTVSSIPFRLAAVAAVLALLWWSSAPSDPGEPVFDWFETELHLIAPASSVEEQRAAVLAITAEAYADLEARWGPRETWARSNDLGGDFGSPPGADRWDETGSELLGRAILNLSFDADGFKRDVDQVTALFTRASDTAPLAADRLRAVQHQLTDSSRRLGAMVDRSKPMPPTLSWSEFDLDNSFVRLGISKIKNASNLIALWAENWEFYAATEHLPSQEDFTLVEHLLYEGTENMGAYLTGTSGAVQELAEAVDENPAVADSDDDQSLMLDYLNYNKGVMARTLVSLRWLADHDRSPGFEVIRRATVGRMQDTVRKLYAISGVPLPEVEGPGGLSQG